MAYILHKKSITCLHLWHQDTDCKNWKTPNCYSHILHKFSLVELSVQLLCLIIIGNGTHRIKDTTQHTQKFDYYSEKHKK